MKLSLFCVGLQTFGGCRHSSLFTPPPLSHLSHLSLFQESKHGEEKSNTLFGVRVRADAISSIFLCPLRWKMQIWVNVQCRRGFVISTAA